ncbi:hypothetical protein E8E15_008580 [Penicillium rubens]|nr:hypothetical protein E8E15_008580 [Penicillium rubens]
MDAESVINHSFADDRLHIFFTRTARDFSDNLVVHKVYFGKDSNDQELVIIQTLGGPSNSNLVRAIFESLADALKSQLRRGGVVTGDLARFRLTGSDLTGSDLTGSDLTGSTLTGSALTGSALTGSTPIKVATSLEA